MNELEKIDKVISSIDLMKRTGLSRATMNNYIKMGILPRPLVKRPSDKEHVRAKRIGYFPDSVLGVLDLIIQYKNEGHSMEEILKRLMNKSDISSGQDQITGILTTPVGLRSSDGISASQEQFMVEENRLGTVPLPLPFSVLAAEVEDSIKICAELPPEDYFRLIDQIWKCANGTLKKYCGVYGKHAGNGIVYYYLKECNPNYLINAIICALELREKMKKVSEEWKKDKGWSYDLHLNIGINEGYEFFGRIPAAPTGDLITLGDTTDFALRLSNFARCGSIWTTKNLLNRVDEKERKKIRYGIRHSQTTHAFLIENTFSRIGDLLPKNNDKYKGFDDISPMIITEIFDLR